MAVQGYTLLADAIKIRDAVQVNYCNTSRIGGWMRKVLEWQGNSSGDAYTRAAQIESESSDSGNTAQKVGLWMQAALNVTRYRDNRYLGLFARAESIKNEWVYGGNTPQKVGRWFIDYLSYIGYTGDDGVELGTLKFLFNIESTSINYMWFAADASGYFDFYIDWGDGSSIEHVTGNFGTVTHRFLRSGDVEVEVYGSATNLSVTLGGSSRTQLNRRLVEITEIGRIAGLKTIGNWGRLSTRLTNVANVDSNDVFGELENISQLFQGCTSLKSIPTFFNYIPNVKSIYYTFTGCTSITNIPSTFLSGNYVLQDCRNMFNGCTSLTGVTPKTDGVELWERNDNLDKFSRVSENASCFAGCTNLSNYNSIPSTWK